MKRVTRDVSPYLPDLGSGSSLDCAAVEEVWTFLAGLIGNVAELVAFQIDSY